MKKRHFAILLAGLMFVGAGCADKQKATDALEAASAGKLDPYAMAYKNPAPSANPNPEPMQKSWSFPGALPEKEIADKQVRITTAKGEIVFELFEKEAPKTVSNFVYLANGGYYDGLTFHRRVEGFVIQGGDPNGNGTGGPGYKFEDEPVKRPYDRGIVAMANSGPDTNGSQFFIMLADYPLPPQYTVFGKVTSGMEVVDAIVVGDAMTKVAVEAKK